MPRFSLFFLPFPSAFTRKDREPVGFKRVPGFLQTRLGKQKVPGESVRGDTRTPLPIDLVHDLCPLLHYLRVTLFYYVAEVQPFDMQPKDFVLNQYPAPGRRGRGVGSADGRKAPWSDRARSMGRDCAGTVWRLQLEGATCSTPPHGAYP